MSALRDEKGRFQPGPMPPELRAAIGQGQIERHRRDRESQGPRPTQKRCSRCKEVKRVPEDFPMRNRVLKSGDVVKYPAGECLECQRKRGEAWRAKQDPEVLRARQREWNKSRNAENRRQYQREYQRALRRSQGATERGPWKRYRYEALGGSDPYIDRAPMDALIAATGLSNKELERRTGVDNTVLTRTGNKRVRVSIADRVFTGLGVPDQFYVEYPELFADDPS